MAKKAGFSLTILQGHNQLVAVVAALVEGEGRGEDMPMIPQQLTLTIPPSAE